MYPIPVISNGHGALINGVPQTEGKRSPVWSNGQQLFEGEFNRAIVARVIEVLAMQGIPYYQLTPEVEDVHRMIRVQRANQFHVENRKNTFILDIHSNAAPKRIAGKGKGSEVHIAVNASAKSERLAKVAQHSYKSIFEKERFRGIKRHNWSIVHKTLAPAALMECFFMDNERECKNYLMTSSGRDKITDWVLDTIYNYQENKELNQIKWRSFY